MVTKVKGVREGKVVPRSATIFKKSPRSLANDQWAVHTTDSNIQNAIAEYMAKRGEGSLIDGDHITWKKRQAPVFFVPFCIAEFLKNNRNKFPNYVSFHRRKRRIIGSGPEYGSWDAWKEGRTTPNAFLQKVFKNWEKV